MRKRRLNKRGKAVLLASVFAVGTFCGSYCEELHTAKALAAAEAEKAVYANEIANVDDLEYTYAGEFRTTAYCACEKCCGEWADGITASGALAVEGVTIAADTSILPFGTNVVIAGNEYTVQDTGSAIRGNRIDIFFADHNAALEYGVQNKDVYIK